MTIFETSTKFLLPEIRNRGILIDVWENARQSISHILVRRQTLLIGSVLRTGVACLLSLTFPALSYAVTHN